ncbi:hypothetical protein [Streptomyces noursei]
MAQYTRCGCSVECPCVVRGGKGIKVTGTGNPDDPYIISTDGTIDCKTVMTCVCSNIQPRSGLGCTTDGKLCLFLEPSGDGAAQNCLTIGPKGGLYVPCPTPTPPTPAEQCCLSVTKIKNERAAGTLIWGTYQGGRALVPWGTMRSTDHAVAIGAQVNVNWVKSGLGCTGFITPYPTFKGDWAHPSLTSYAQDPPHSDAVAYQHLTPAQWISFTKNVGRYYDTGFEDRPSDGGILMSQHYALYNCKLVDAWIVQDTTNYTGVLATIDRWCAAKSSIIFHWDEAKMKTPPGDQGNIFTPALSRGIECGVLVSPPPKPTPPDPDSPWSGNYTATLAASAKSAGATWAAVSMRMTDDQIKTFTAAGLLVLGYDTIRQSDVTRAKTLGLAGLLSDDMVYQRGGDAGHPEQNCFTPVVHDSWSIGSGMQGQAHPPQNTTAYRRRMGYPKAGTAQQPCVGSNCGNGLVVGWWHLPAGYGAAAAATTENDTCPSLLMGGMSTLPEMKGPGGNYADGKYKIEYHAGWVDAAHSDYETLGLPKPGDPSTPSEEKDEACKFGIFVCAPTDKNITGKTANAEGYICFIRPRDGELVIGMWDGAAGYKELASQAMHPASRLPANVGNRYYVTVEPGKITFLAERGAVTVVAQSPDAGKYRGGYWHIVKEELLGTNFEARFGDIKITKA